MKQLFILLSIAVVASCSSNKTETAKETTTETSTKAMPPEPPVPPAIPVAHGKNFIKEQFEESYLTLAKAVKGLTPEQIAFKPAADKWSIGETLEHIVKTEPALLGWLQDAMAQPANPEARSEIKMKDDLVLAIMTDRSHKATAPQELAPQGKYTEASTALTDLTKQREAIFNYLDNVTMEDLRNHVTDSPGGKMDGYQLFLCIPGHTMRHTLQIQEIKTDPDFPKK
ncbi:MAG TPA: DinB family protein [Flavobacterium sp.]|nr:DinB family protein [Flavobacterium sp.]